MRVFSFAQESTRYCNYSKNKFGNELTFIDPLWCNYDQTPVFEKNPSYLEANMVKLADAGSNDFKKVCNTIEQTYFKMINAGWQPQQAATVLPNALKTELCMTGFISDWEHFFDLRALDKTGPAHPQAKELALPLYNEFKEKGYL